MKDLWKESDRVLPPVAVFSVIHSEVGLAESEVKDVCRGSLTAAPLSSGFIIESSCTSLPVDRKFMKKMLCNVTRWDTNKAIENKISWATRRIPTIFAGSDYHIHPEILCINTTHRFGDKEQQGY